MVGLRRPTRPSLSQQILDEEMADLAPSPEAQECADCRQDISQRGTGGTEGRGTPGADHHEKKAKQENNNFCDILFHFLSSPASLAGNFLIVL